MVENLGSPRTTNCVSWESFCKAVRLGDGSPMEPIYRGHADCSWSLVPPSARGQFEKTRTLQSRGVEIRNEGPAFRGQVNYFKRLATGLPGVDLSGLEEIDIETLARHHGLSSNLLDWTESPYIAAFFAFTTALDLANGGRLLAGTLAQDAIFPPPKPVCIWRLGIAKELLVSNEFDVVSSLSATNYWQKAQLGVFTRLTHKDHLDIESYLVERNMLEHLEKFIIPGTETMKALSDLEAMNITYASLFPDLKGAALQANVGMTWKLFGGL